MAKAIAFQGSNSNYQKCKTNSNDKCYNYHQKDYYSRDCQFSDQKRKTSNSISRCYKNQKSLYLNARVNKVMKHSNDFNPESSVPEYTILALIIKKTLRY